MSQSTPLNMIRRNGSQTDQSSASMPADMNTISMSSDSQLVEDILKEMGDSPGTDQQSNINSQSLQYAMDRAQVPPHKYMPSSNDDMNYNNYSQKMMMDQTQNGILGQLGISLNGDSIKERIIKNIKYPGLVFVLCFLISLPEFNRFIFSFFPKLLLESGQVSIGGVILKALIGMLIFASIALFI